MARSPRKSTGQPAPVKVIDVAAGLVFRDGKLLITQRLVGGHLGGFWEFPGGKVEPDETFDEALHRELDEELAIKVQLISLVDSVEHAYPEKTVRLKFYLCRWRKNEPKPIGCSSFAWVTREELVNYTFPAADAQLIERLTGSDEFWR
jgi:mutator protein MutT